VILQLNIVEGKMQYLYDEHGRRYLDAFAGIATVCCGHSHPEILDAITAQARRLQHSTVFYRNHAIADFADCHATGLRGPVLLPLLKPIVLARLLKARVFASCHSL
jgi:alanine-glyoxylate transaminase / (R)-3-amino-2-methylpropionate-pyruvate transaminase